MSFESTLNLQFNLTSDNQWTNSVFLDNELQFDKGCYVKFISSPACLIEVEGLSFLNYEFDQDGNEFQSSTIVTSEDMCYYISNQIVKQLKITAKPQPEFENQTISLVVIFFSTPPIVLTP